MSSETGYLLALTADPAERRKALAVIAKRLGLELVHIDKTPAALSWLMGRDPSLVVVDSRIPKAEQLALKLRGKKTLSSLPVISLSEEMSDVFTANSYASGADDVIPVHAGAQLAQRLRALPKSGAPKLAASRGVAVVADANRARCDLLTRVLAGAGYEVKSAIDERSLQFYQKQHGPSLFVVNSELTDVRQAVLASRRDGRDVAWVITASRRELDSLSDSLHDARKVVVTGANAPPTDTLFLANELLHEGRTSRRKGSRKLLGTVVRFREAGTEEEDYGFTYNVSERGMYVRTIAPPAYEEVWLELMPPKAKHWVRLLGRVAWRHAFNPGIQSLSPPGFGVELLAGLGQDLESFSECYAAFSDNAPRGAGRSTFVPARRASVGFMPRVVPPAPGAREPQSRPSVTDVRDSWLSSEELVSIPPPEGDDLVRDSEWDTVEDSKSPSSAASASGPPSSENAGGARKAASEGGEARTEKVKQRESDVQVASSEKPLAAAAEGDEADGRGLRDGPPSDSGEKAFDSAHSIEATEGDATELEAEPAADDEADETDEDEADETDEDEEREGDEEDQKASGRPAVFDREGLRDRPTASPEKKGGGLSFFKLLLLGGATAAVTALIYTSTQKHDRAPVAATPSAPSVPNNALEAAHDEEQSAPSAAPTEAALPGPPASRPEEPSAAPSGQAPSSEPARAPTFDVASLEPDQGALRVTASGGQASVFVLGVEKGKVGDWLTVKCGMQFVRLGRGDPPVWVSKGRSMVIPCKKATTAEFEISD